MNPPFAVSLAIILGIGFPSGGRGQGPATGTGSLQGEASLPMPSVPGQAGPSAPGALPTPTPGMDGVNWDGKSYKFTDLKPVDAMFSAYLSEPEISYEEEKEYTALIEELLERLDVFRVRNEGKKLLEEVLPILKRASRHARDGGMCRQIYNAVGTDVQSKDSGVAKKDQIKKLEKEIDTMKWNLQIAAQPGAMDVRPSRQSTADWFKYEEAQKEKEARIGNMQTELEGKYAEMMALQNSIVSRSEDSRLAMQRVVLGLFILRRFDHVLIASSFYRLLYADGGGEVKLQQRLVEEAAANAKKLRAATGFDRSRSVSEQSGIGTQGVYSNRTVTQTDREDGITSMLPTATDALGAVTGTKIKAAGMIPDTMTELEMASQEAIDKCVRLVSAVRGHLAQQELDNALERLREAFGAGEHLKVIRAFPREQKQVLWQYKKMLEEARSGLATKDLGKAQAAMAKLNQMTTDNPLSREFSEMGNVQSISAMHLGKAKEAALRGDRETMNKELEAATKAWPQNPDLAEGARKMLEQMSQQAQGKEELRKLIQQKNHTFIAEDKARFLAVAADDPKLLAELQSILEKEVKVQIWQAKAEELIQRGNAPGGWELAEAGLQQHPENSTLSRLRADAAAKCPEFVREIDRARASEQRNDPVAALGAYLSARNQYPASETAKEKIRQLSDKLLQN